MKQIVLKDGTEIPGLREVDCCARCRFYIDSENDEDGEKHPPRCEKFCFNRKNNFSIVWPWSVCDSFEAGV